MGIVGWVEDPAKGNRSAVSTGRRELMGLPSSDAYRGTTRLGNKYIIQGGPKPTTRATTVGVRMKGSATYPPPTPTEPPPQTDTPPTPTDSSDADSRRSPEAPA